MVRIVLGLGSNTSYKELSSIEILSNAVKRLKELVYDVKFSSVYESKAMYVTNQSNFYNMAITGFVEDSVSPFVLLKFINEVEAEFGRDRSKEIRFGPRSLDIDIEEYGDLCIETSDLQIPHPRMKEREFVLIPVLEILDKSADCKLREKLNSYLSSLSPQGVKKCPEDIQVLFGTFMKADFYGTKAK